MLPTSPCVSPLSPWKSLQKENILTTNGATCLSVCPSPVSPEIPYKWKISSQPTVLYTPSCTCPSPVSVEILTKGKYPYNQWCYLPLRVSLSCLSRKSLQMDNILITNCATYISVYPFPVSLENPYKWKISLQAPTLNISLCVSLPCLSGKSLQMGNILTTETYSYCNITVSPFHCPCSQLLINPLRFWDFESDATYVYISVLVYNDSM